MKKIIPLVTLVFFSCIAFAQEFKGQWKGQFIDNSSTFMGWGGERCDYVLELETNGNDVTGYSYTYFNDGGKRFYTICRLKGKINKREKYIEVTEIERTKTNVPNHIRNCFQVHKLTYFKKDDVQTLEGSWSPAPNQEGDCGYGTTVLSRRILKRETPLFNNATARNIKPEKKPDNKSINTDKNKPVAPPLANNITKPPVAPPPPVVKTNPPAKPEIKIPTDPVVKNDPDIRQRPDANFERRNSNFIKTIELDNETFKVDLYDNGDIDGDSISLFFNGKLLLSHKRLSDKAISLTLNTEDNRDVNELVMYAENLGEIPPNTALMVVTDGTHRYEVRITSDLEKSGAIRFIHKPKPAQ
ncbi:hypothetical protein [Ferruginibacter sp. SUN106]|uniref:hypothetical protein n=1 Tax=Ferruginibacter sp. SUN106 TaxID=2978348 RepID=UPI003D35FDCF